MRHLGIERAVDLSKGGEVACERRRVFAARSLISLEELLDPGAHLDVLAALLEKRGALCAGETCHLLENLLRLPVEILRLRVVACHVCPFVARERTTFDPSLCMVSELARSVNGTTRS